MEFEIHGGKFNYEYGNIYRFYELKKGDEWKQIKLQTDSKKYKYFGFRVSNKRYNLKLHRLMYWLHNPDWDIMDSSQDNSIDHIDGNNQNNNIENLRVVTNQENSFNMTRAKGYHWDKTAKKWRATIALNGKVINLARFDKEIDARNCYLDAKKKYHIIKS
tara:strand:- start:21 stop:503 length:483 start_codon:yes stop_codon:yes gene_type:complete